MIERDRHDWGTDMACFSREQLLSSTSSFPSSLSALDGIMYSNSESL